MKQQLKGSLMLLLAAMIWGAAFVAQSASLDYIEPFTLQASRFFLSGTVLLPFALLTRPQSAAKDAFFSTKKTLTYGVACGIFLCIASAFQQFGLVYTSVGKSGFITALYIILVPLAGIFLKKKVSAAIWLSVALALCGLYFLSFSGEGGLNLGDVLTFCSAIFFTFQILLIDHIGTRIRGVALACIQSFTVSFLSTIGMLIFEHPTWEAILSCWLPIAYAGICSGGIAYTLQILGQQKSDPTVASIIMSSEAVFAAFFGWLILGQNLAPREYLGCAVMLCAIMLAQLPLGKKT